MALNHRYFTPVLVAVTLCLSCATTSAGPKHPVDTQAQFARAAEGFYWSLFEMWPTWGVSLGYHQYDGKLADVSEANLRTWIGRLHQADKTLSGFEPSHLSTTQRVEREVLLTQIHNALFELEVLRDPWRNPMFYMWGIGLNDYIARDYAPLQERAKAIAMAARGTGALLGQARNNLQQAIPRTWLQTALLQVDGTIAFVAKGGDVRTALAGLNDAALKAEVDAALDEMGAALAEHKAFLEARKKYATDAFALGADKFLRLLEAGQGVHVSLEHLEQIAEADLQRNLKAIEAAAKRIDPKRSVKEVVASVMAKKPSANRVLPVATQQAEQMRRFVIDKQIVSIPSDDVAEVRETPPFQRWNAAFLFTAGVFENKPLPSFYYISPPDPTWPKDQQQAYIPATTDLLFISIHEVWPGHFLHHLHIKQNESVILKSFWNYVMGEGWAHYTEELMWNQGVGDGDPEVHIGQLLNALLRNVRFISAIGLHTKGMTVAESEALFREKAFQDPGNASQQAVRGTFDPMYLAYTIGKLMIIKLRGDWKAKMGDAYSLQAFHDAFLSYGAAPIPTIRRAMLGEDSGDVL